MIVRPTLSFLAFASFTVSLALLTTACTTDADRLSLKPPAGSASNDTAADPEPVNNSASEVYLNEDCQTTDAKDTSWQVVDRLVFTAQGKTHWLSRAQYQDGMAILCVSEPNFVQSKPVQVDGSIDQVVQSDRPAVFQVTAHQGNGRAATDYYQLDLSTPEQPQVVLLKSEPWRAQHSPNAAPTESVADTVTLSNDEWTVMIGNRNSWSGVNNTGNLTYRGCDTANNCIDLTGGTVSERQGYISYVWRNGEYSYNVNSPVTAAESSVSTSTLVVRQNDRVILRATGLR